MFVIMQKDIPIFIYNTHVMNTQHRKPNLLWPCHYVSNDKSTKLANVSSKLYPTISTTTEAPDIQWGRLLSVVVSC